MTGSTESVSPPHTETGRTNKVLIVGLNWLGDAIMSMPAIQHFHAKRPADDLYLLTKPALKPLWQMHAVPDHILTISPGNSGVVETAKELKRLSIDEAFILPNSFRSALIPRLAGIPQRTGLAGQLRTLTLTRKLQLNGTYQSLHQSRENAAVLGIDTEDLPLPTLCPPIETRRHIQVKRSQHAFLLGLIPGAARGPSKRWPEENYTAIAKRATEQGGTVILLGTREDESVCSRIEAACEGGIINLAAKTNMQEFATLLKMLHAVVCNDSGGMHLAAALGTPVIAIFGITDPAKTSPLGPSCTVLQKSTKRTRDISRHSAEAIEALKAITPDDVYGKLTSYLPL